MPNPKIRKIERQHVAWMKWCFENTFTVKDWAAVLGFKSSTIHQIRYKRSYKDVSPKIPIEFMEEGVLEYRLSEVLGTLLEHYSSAKIKIELEEILNSRGENPIRD